MPIEGRPRLPVEGTDRRPSNVETMTVDLSRQRTANRPSGGIRRTVATRRAAVIPLITLVAVIALFTSACAQNAVMNVAAARNETRGDGPSELATPSDENGGDEADGSAGYGRDESGTPADGEAPAGGFPGFLGGAPGAPRVADGVPPGAPGATPAPGPPGPGQIPGPGAPLFPPPDTEFTGSNAKFCADATGAIAGLSTLFQQTSGSGSDPFSLIRTLATGMRKSAQQFDGLVRPAPKQVKPAVKTVAVELDKIASSMERLDIGGMQGLSGGPLSRALADLTSYMSTDCTPKA
jgi:hypothetical protein